MPHIFNYRALVGAAYGSILAPSPVTPIGALISTPNNLIIAPSPASQILLLSRPRRRPKCSDYSILHDASNVLIIACLLRAHRQPKYLNRCALTGTPNTHFFFFRALTGTLTL